MDDLNKAMLTAFDMITKGTLSVILAFYLPLSLRLNN